MNYVASFMKFARMFFTFRLKYHDYYSVLLAAYRTATLRHDEDMQVKKSNIIAILGNVNELFRLLF